MIIFFQTRQRAISMANRLKQVAQIFAIGITNQTDDEFLSAISSGGEKNKNWFNTPTFEGLQEIRDQVVQLTCAGGVGTTNPATSSPTTTPSSVISKWFQVELKYPHTSYLAPILGASSIRSRSYEFNTNSLLCHHRPTVVTRCVGFMAFCYMLCACAVTR
jgi:hypothetical protein